MWMMSIRIPSEFLLNSNLMEGIRVPWNERVNYPIYMAAPDFDYVDTKKLDVLEESLFYHHFMNRPYFPLLITDSHSFS